VVFAKMLPLRKHFFCPRKLIQNIDGSRLKKPYPYLFNQVILKEATHDRIHQRWHQRFRQSGSLLQRIAGAPRRKAFFQNRPWHWLGRQC
jgi:hypothetical protein